MSRFVLPGGAPRDDRLGRYGFAAAVQPGQYPAFLVAQTLTNGWRRTVPAALAPLISDVPIVALVLIVLKRLPPLLLGGLRIAGGVFLLTLAAAAARAATRFEQACATPAPVHQTVLKAALVNLLDPSPYLAWTLGPLLLEAWRQGPALGIGLVSAFHLTMVSSCAVMIVALAGARSFGPVVVGSLVALSAVALAGFGIYQLWAGGTALAGSMSPRAAP